MVSFTSVVKPRTRPQQCRSNIVECYKVERCFDIVAGVDWFGVKREGMNEGRVVEKVFRPGWSRAHFDLPQLQSVPEQSVPLPSNRQHLSYGDCLEGKRGDYLTSSVLLCIIIVHIICTLI